MILMSELADQADLAALTGRTATLAGRLPIPARAKLFKWNRDGVFTIEVKLSRPDGLGWVKGFEVTNERLDLALYYAGKRALGEAWLELEHLRKMSRVAVASRTCNYLARSALDLEGLMDRVQDACDVFQALEEFRAEVV